MTRPMPTWSPAVSQATTQTQRTAADITVLTWVDYCWERSFELLSSRFFAPLDMLTSHMHIR